MSKGVNDKIKNVWDTQSYSKMNFSVIHKLHVWFLLGNMALLDYGFYK